MLIPVLLGLITVLSVVVALRKKRPVYFALPVVALMAFVMVKIIMVPMPLWDTIQFIFGLR